VEYDGYADSIFSMQRRNRHRQWLLFTRGVIDKIISFIINGRTTYTAATRHLSADLLSFSLRRQDVVKLGTAAIKTYVIPAETARCPICGPNPKFIVIDAQALGCTDPNDVEPVRPAENCPVLNIPAPKLCVLESAGLRGSIDKILTTATALTGAKEKLLRDWRDTIVAVGRPSPSAAAAAVFFRFFPLGQAVPDAVKKVAPAASAAATAAAGGEAGDTADPATASAASAAAAVVTASGRKGKRRRGKTGLDSSLQDALRRDDDGNLVLGGKGKVARPTETWRDRTGLFAPNFQRYARSDDGLWTFVRPFLQALLTESVAGMFQSHDEAAVRLMADTLRVGGPNGWRELTEALDGVGFVASFIGLFSDALEGDKRFRLSIGELLLHVIKVEEYVTEEFSKQAGSAQTLARGWVNAEYCRRWGKSPTPADYQAWRAEQTHLTGVDADNPLVSFESFAGLPRVRPGIVDLEAAKRRVAYRGKDRHVADVEGEGDACNKAFSIKAGLTQGVFNVVCPHVITFGFRCLFRAESVGEALSVVLERFPKLPEVIFYDVACKIDKNAMRRVRPIMRDHGVRCILDRSHSITHTCSPIYMPDESLGHTAGVTTQAAEVSHSISVVNRTSLAYMRPATYMVHRMLQVGFMNVRKLFRLSTNKGNGEVDHLPLTPFFHRAVSRGCELGSLCEACQPQDAAVTRGVATTATAADRPEEPVADGVGAARPAALRLESQMSIPNDATATTSTPLPLASPATPAGRLVPAVTASDADADDDAPGARRTRALLPCVDRNLLVAHPARANGGTLADSLGGVATLSTRPLSEVQEHFVAGMTDGRDSDEIVRSSNKANIKLSVHDFRRLRGERWLNDAVMDSFIALINHRDAGLAAARGLQPRTRMFNTYFFSRLLARPGWYDYAGVRNWGTKLGLELMQAEGVLVPVNVGGVHWVLVHIRLKERTFLYYDPFGAKDGANVVGTLRRWLNDELRRCHGDGAVAEWDVDSWELCEDVGFPQQSDSGSCGVFVLMVAQCLAAGRAVTFTQEDIVVLRRRLAIVLFLDDLDFVTPSPSITGPRSPSGSIDAVDMDDS